MRARFAVLLLLAAASLRGAEPLPTGHETRQIEGWNVRLDHRLLQEQAETGRDAITLLTHRLTEIARVVPAEPLRRLREVTIQMDFTHGELLQAQYHPSADWLGNHGYSRELARCVHIPQVRRWVSRYENHRMPWALLHELAHAYHDQVLGWEEPRLAAAYEKFRANGQYGSTLTVKGDRRPHYALTNGKEFFAEMSESYLGSNDFYPFVAGELKDAEPDIYHLLEQIWGPLPAKDF